MVRVIITQNDDISVAIDEALSYIDLAALARGKIVAVKPNDTWASMEDTTGVTQPDTLRAVLSHFKDARPRELLVSGGAGAAETDSVFRIAGLMDVLEAEHVPFFDHNRPPFTEVKLAYDPADDVQGPQRSVMVNPRVLGYETLVSLAQLKLHETATVTLSLKNIAMSLPAADYYGHPRSTQKHENHFFEDMHSFIAAMARKFPIGLAIIAGHPAMVGTGPLGGHAVETGIVIASTDPVASDTVGARLLGFRPQAVRHLWEAGRLGPGEAGTDAMEFPALGLQEAIEIFTERVYGERLTFEHA